MNNRPPLNLIFMENCMENLQSTHNKRFIVEREVIGRPIVHKDTEVAGTLNAVCYMCGPVEMTLSTQYGWWDTSTGQYVINWREHLTCPHCGLNNRMRAVVHILDVHNAISKDAPVYITEQGTRLCRILQSTTYPNLVESEFLGNACPLGKVYNGIRNEDMTHLTFADNSLAGVLSFDVLEHIPDYRKALTEVYRCLATGGEFVFSVPFNIDSEKTLIRAEMCPEGNIHNLLPPEYHGDPLDPEKGILCYQTFGWDLLDMLRKMGFEDVKALDYWSREYEYLGTCMLFIARKSIEKVN